MGTDIEQTIAITFRHLDLVLGQALEMSPVADARQLLELIPECSEPAQRLILAELIKLDMTIATEQSLDRDLDFYAVCLSGKFPDGHLPLDLVLEEIQLRRRRAQIVDIRHYQARFPHLAGVLEDVLTRVSSTQVGPPLERAPNFEDGSQVDDFTILKTLGRGGFANVYLARQNSMQRLVALKVSHHGSDEPIALSQLDHPNIVRVYDQRQLQNPELILLYMQYVPGGTLGDCMAQTLLVDMAALDGRAYLRGIDEALLIAGQQAPEHSAIREELSRMDWAQLVAWVGVQLADGLSAAHRAGILHRDVKPANVLLSSEGIPKLADFNVSFTGVPGCAGAAVHFGGSLAYMSPEQLEIADPTVDRDAADLDQRSDIYSLSMVLWELWQGRRPALPDQMFSSWHSAVTQQVHLRRQTPQVCRRFETAAERVLERTLRSCLEIQREDRPASAAQLASGLRLALLDQAVLLFEPAVGSLRARLRNWPVLVTVGLMVILPNALASGLNFLYNLQNIHNRFGALESRFVVLSIVINLVAFPVGIFVLAGLVAPVQRGMRAVLQKRTVRPEQFDAAWNLGHRAAMIGGCIWLMAGIAFPIVLSWWEPSFSIADALEFFLSLAICGGIAWIYPFFGASLIATEVYYPALVAPTMIDEQFSQRAKSLEKRATVYLASAAAIPLFALALLSLRQPVSQTQDAGAFLLVVVLLTAVALLFAFQVHQRLLRTVKHLGQVLTTSN